VQRGFPTAPDQVYVGDITFLPTTYGEWLYLMSWMDLFSRYVVGWKVEDHMEDLLAIESLQLAFSKRNPSPGIMIHTTSIINQILFLKFNPFLKTDTNPRYSIKIISEPGSQERRINYHPSQIFRYS
jgi:hypothetical protein